MTMTTTNHQVLFKCNFCPNQKTLLGQPGRKMFKELQNLGWGAQPAGPDSFRHLCPSCYRKHQVQVQVRRDHERSYGRVKGRKKSMK
jgi:hypothetical protein